LTDRSVRVLLVEDNLGDATLLSILFEEALCPMKLTHVHNGEEALNYIRDHNVEGRPDLILLDLKMPRMSGLDFLRERQKDRGISSIPTIVLTGSDARSDQDEAMLLGADMYMMKPGDIDEADSILPTIEMFIKRFRPMMACSREDP
jgi:CheY-like chemotaxis protein